jgi:hypothetical protein
MAMTGGTAKLVHTGYGQYGNTNFPIKLYVYYKTSTNASTLKSTITCGMYVTTPSGWDIGSWYDSSGSYVGTTKLTFDGEIPNFSGTRWLVEDKSFEVSHNATTGEATATIYWKWGVNSPWGQTVNPSGLFSITLPKIITACSAPTTLTATSDVSGQPFESKVTLAWSGAKSGTANSINKYEAQYRVYANSAWGSWTALGEKSSTATSSNSTVDMSSKVNRGEYVQFRIRTQGTAGTSYYSSWKTSDYIQRQPYTQCVAPTTFTATPNPFEDTVTLTWSGADNGTANTISSYYIQYCTTQDNKTWDSWVGLKTVTSTAKSGSCTIDMSSKVLRGKNVRFRIRTQGTAGSSYYSDYKIFSYITRQTYGKCEPPTSFVITDINAKSTTTFEVKASWSGAKSGDENTISSYFIQYAVSQNNSTWGDWVTLSTISSTATQGEKAFDMTSDINRSEYVKFRIQVRGTAGASFYSDYCETTNVIRRNPYTNCVMPNVFTVTTDLTYKDEAFFEKMVTLNWSGASSGINNPISGYKIYCMIGLSSEDNVVQGYQLLTQISSTSGQGSVSIDMTNLSNGLIDESNQLITEIPRKYYVKFKICTTGNAGNDYDSEAKIAFYTKSNGSTTYSIQRNPYTKCLPPITITLTSEKGLDGNTYTDVYNTQIIATWSGANKGEENNITGYSVDYRISIDNQTWSDWKSYFTISTTAKSHSCNMLELGSSSISADGYYAQFRIKTLGTRDGYDSDYLVSSVIRKNSKPSILSSINVHLSDLEYSYGDDITISWDKPNDIDNNIYQYNVIAYQKINDRNEKILDTTINGVNNSTFTLNKDDTVYKSIKNNQQLKFAVKAIDVFGVSAETYQESSVITRYDDTGMRIFINGKWTPCQLYFGKSGKWVEQSLCAGLNNSWSQCGVV